MRTRQRVPAIVLGFILLASGCAHSAYRVYVYNETPGKITEAKVKLPTGESLTFGTVVSQVDAGIWPVTGPLDGESLVEWTDSNQKKNSAKTSVMCGFWDDSVIFVIQSNRTVRVEVGRDRFGLEDRD